MNKQGKSHGCLLIVIAFFIIIIGCNFLAKLYPLDPSVSTSCSTVPSSGATTSSTINDHYDYGSRENPREITYDDVPSLRPDTYVCITGPVSCFSSSTGQFTIGEGDTCYGLRIAVQNDDETRYYEIEAPSINANGYENEFNAHCPYDVYYYPRTENDRRYTGCTATIVGRYESYLAYVDGEYIEFYRLASDSRIVDLRFYY